MKLLPIAVFFALVTRIYGAEPAVQPSQGEPAVQNEALRQELRAMFAEDQRVRVAGMKALAEAGVAIGSADGLKLQNPKGMLVMITEAWKMTSVDQKHRKRLKEMVEEHGWPGKTLVGKDGANAAWLLVQHSDADVAFQKKCLRLMEAAPEGEVSKTDMAYLTDRVLVNEKKKQRYGTQMGNNFEPRPIEDAEHVDQRRAKIGLPPLEEYVAEAKKQYEKWSRGE